MSSLKRLRRLDNVWIRNPVYFITSCTYQRQRFLANPDAHKILRDEWTSAFNRHGWAIGSYVLMPDHVHFFARPVEGEASPLPRWMQAFKEWTSKGIGKANATVSVNVWQADFFDHVLRSGESYSEKWDYVRQNPVRAGLVDDPEDWEYSGEIVSLEF